MTVVIVLFTITTDETVLTNTFVIIDKLEADPVVLAGTGDAVINHILTVSALETWRTSAGVTSHITHTGCPILAGIVDGADVEVRGEFTVRSVETGSTRAGIIIFTVSGLKQVNS